KGSNEPRDLPVLDAADVTLPSLAGIAELDGMAVDLDVCRPQRGEPEGSVVARVDLAAGTHEGAQQNADHAGEHAFARESGPGEVARHAGPQPGKRLEERPQPFVLPPLTDRLLARRITVLPPAGAVSPDGLNGGAGRGADEDVDPCRRQDQGTDAREIPRADGAVGRRVVTEAGGRSADASDAGFLKTVDDRHLRASRPAV